MSANEIDMPVHAVDPNRNRRQWWSVISALLATAIFSEAVFAGVMLSGIGWGRAAHTLSAGVLVASTLAAGIAATVTLRHILNGRRLGLTLLALAGVLLVQTALGRSSSAGLSLMWLHVPLGVAIVGLAAQAVVGARNLGGMPALGRSE
jgi:hypothetical protein